MTNNERVMAYIKKTFDIDHVSLSGFPLLPGGVIVRDRGGEEMLFYWDILGDGIRWTGRKRSEETTKKGGTAKWKNPK